jgi:hypothetical protein
VPIFRHPTLDDSNTAHYLCSVLNSSPAQFVVLSYAVNIQMDTHVLQNICIPYYNTDDPVHNQLTELSRHAHEATATGDTSQVQTIEAEIDQLAAQLWGLTRAELRDIQTNLEELQ